MFPDNLNPLPVWRNPLPHDDDEADLWKWKEELQAAEALYNQWREIFGLVTALADSLPEVGDENEYTRRFIYENAMIVAPKIMGAAGDTLYQIKMENAALIRFNCRQLWEQVAWSAINSDIEESYKTVIEDSLEKFKNLFRQWVGTFRKDDIEDDWGLF